MWKNIRFHFEKLSIHRRMYVLLGVFALMFVLLFGILFGVMVHVLQDAAFDRQAQILTLACADMENALGNTQDLALSLVAKSSIKDYISSDSGEAEKNTLASMMNRNILKNFDIANNVGVLDFMVVRSEDDYVRSGTTYVGDQGIYGRLSRYICDNYEPGQNCMVLPGYLGYVLDCYCYVLPLADSATNTLQRGGYLVLLVDNYFFPQTLKRFFETDTIITIIDSDFHTAFTNDQNEAPDMEAVLLELSQNEKITVRINGKKHLVLTRQLKDTDWTLVMHKPTSSVTSQIQQFWALFALFLLLFGGVTAIVINMLSRSITNRLKEMVSVITSIREGDIDSRFPVVYQDEISIIGSEFNRMIDQLQKFHLNAAMQELRRKEAELSALQSSINPHFLYNSLDCIRASALVNNDMRVAHQIQILANMFRYTTGTNSMRRDTVTVEAEMKHVNDYLSMINFRFDDRYTVEVHMEQAVLPMKIPRLILQPVVENAFSHGMRSIASGGKVQICGNIDGDSQCIVLTVEDNGVGIPADRLEHIQSLLKENPLSVSDTPYRALVNINDRIRIAYGREYGVWLESTPGKGTRTLLRLPITKE